MVSLTQCGFLLHSEKLMVIQKRLGLAGLRHSRNSGEFQAYCDGNRRWSRGIAKAVLYIIVTAASSALKCSLRAGLTDIKLCAAALAKGNAIGAAFAKGNQSGSFPFEFLFHETTPYVGGYGK